MLRRSSDSENSEDYTNLFLFYFFHKLDMQRVINGGSWTFDRYLLLTRVVTPGIKPNTVQLFHADIWFQIFDLPCGFLAERVVRDIGNFIGSFIESDQKRFESEWREYARARISINIRKPLKRSVGKIRVSFPQINKCYYSYE